jgi:hypothetical protein
MVKGKAGKARLVLSFPSLTTCAARLATGRAVKLLADVPSKPRLEPPEKVAAIS